jgi:uncharacterized membrane protein
MALIVEQTMARHTWVARPNRALSPLQAHRLILAAALISGGIALAFATFGAWPVLPFAGLEIGALWLALSHLRRHADDEERIEIMDDRITVVLRNADRCEHHEFSRYWARLQVEKLSGTENRRLLLRSHGREIEVGRLMTAEQKQALERDLRSRLGQ